jgi:phosphatidylglycerophosphatase A
MHKIPARLLSNPLHLLALGFGAGCAPKAPGTFGTLVGVLLYLPLQSLSLPHYLILLVLLCVAGIPVCGYTARALGMSDHPGIVWDEICGYLLAMTAAPAGWGWVLAGYILFRLFDIWKPWPIRWLDKNVKGGAGIMADDLMAGLISLTLMQITAYIL